MKVNGKSKTPITAAQSENRESGGKKARAAKQTSKNKNNGVKTAALKRISDGILALDAGMNYTYLNDRAGELLGRSAEELIGKNLREEYPDGERTPFMEACQRALKTQSVVWLDEYFALTDRWLEGRVYPSEDGVSVLFTEGRQRNTEYRLSMLSMFPVQNPAPVMRLTQEGKILYANPAATALLETWKRNDNLANPFLKIQELLPQVIQSSTNCEIEIESEGQVFSCQIVPFRKGEYANLYFSDITARKQVEQSLLTLVNQTSAGIGQIDFQGRFTFANQALCDMLGYPKPELMGKAYWDVTEPHSVEKNKLWIGQMLVKGESFQKEKRLLRKNGSTVWASVGGSPVRDLDGRIRGGTLVFVDISRRKRAEESLLESARRSMFLASLSDTIRTIDDPSKIEIDAARLLGAHLKVSRAAYVEMEKDGTGFIRDDYSDDLPKLNGAFEVLKLIPQDQKAKFQAGHTVVVSDVQNDPRFDDAQRSAYEALSIRSHLIRPFRHGGQVVAALSLQQSQPRLWREEEISVAEESAERIQAAVERAAAEQKLRETEERFRQAANASRALVYDVDLISGATAIVHGMEGLAGFDPQETTASSDWWHSLIHPDDLPAHLIQLENLLETGDMDVCEYRLQHKNGEWIIVQDNRLVLRNEAGNSVRLIGTVIDITGRKKLEQELREGERKFNLIFNKLPFSAVLTRPEDGTLVNINEEFENLFGYTREEAIGHTLAELGTDTRQRDRVEILEQLQTSVPVRDMELELVTRPHGPRTFLVNTDPVNVGGSQYILQTAQDITERKQEQDLLRTKEAELEEIIHHTPFMLTRCTRDLRYRFVSRAYAEMIGRTPEQVNGKSILEIMGQDGMNTILPYVEQVLRGERVEYESEVSFEGVRSPGLHIIYTPDRDPEGNVIGWFASIVDITERQRMETALRESEQKFSLIYDKLPFAAVLSRPQDGVIVDVNQEFERVFGVPKQDAIGRTSPELGINPSAEQRSDILAELQTKGSLRGMEISLVTKPLGPRIFLMNIDLVSIGGIRYILQTAQDITERKRIEQELARERELLERLFESMPVMVSMYDPGTKSIRLNAEFERAIGWKQEELSVVSLLNTLYPDPEYQKEVLQRMAKAGKNEWVEVQVKTRQGNTLDSLWSNISIFEDQQLVQGIALGIDITERKRAEQELAEFARQQQAFYVLADQLNNTRSLEDVFEPALDAILSALQCDRASILLYDDENVMRFVAWRGLSDAYRRATDGHSPWTPEAKDPEPIYIDNIDTSDQEEHLKTVIRDEGISSLAFIPMVSNGKLIGKFMVYFNHPHTFAKDELELGLTIARQLASSVERKRAEEQLRRSAEFDAYRITLTDTLRPLNDPLKIQTEAMRVLGERLQVDRVLFSEIDEINQVSVIHDNYVQEGISKIVGRMPLRDYGKTGEILSAGKTLVIPDATTSPDLREADRARFAAQGILSCMGAPMIKDGRWVATLGVLHGSPRKWSKEEIALLEETAERTWTALERARAEEALHASESLYRTIARSIPGGGVYVVDKDFHYRVAEGSVTEAFGLSREMLEGHAVSEVFRGEQGVRLESRLKRNFAGETLSYENEHNGRIYWTQQAPLLGSFGQAIIVTIDITERKKAEQALQLSEQRMGLAIESNRMVAWEWDPSSDRVTTSSNVAEVYGVSDVSQAGEGFAMIWEEDLPAHQEKVDRITRQGGEYTSEFRITRPVDGRVVWMEERARALTDDQGRVTRLVGIVTDITERKRAEERLRASEDRLRLAVTAGKIGIWDIDLVRRERTWSKEGKAIYGLAEDEFLDFERQLELTYPEDRKYVDQAVRAFRDQGTIKQLNLEHRILHPDGSVHWVEVQGEAVYEDKPLPVRLIGTIVDITERKKNEEELRLARIRAEETADLMARLQDVTASLAGAVTAGQLAGMILEQGTRATEAAASILVELVNDGRELKTIAAIGYPPGVLQTEPVSLSNSTPLSDCIIRKQAVWLESQEEFADQYPQIGELRGGFGQEATVALPLIVGGQVLGGLAFSFTEKHKFLLEERGFLLAMAQQCAQALERVRAEESVRESQQRLALTYNHAAIGLVETSPDARMIQCNDQFCRILGYTKEELTERYIYEITFEEDNRIERALYQQLMAGQIPFYRIEKRFVRKDGSLFWCELVRSVVLDNEGQARFGIGAVFDVNERKLKEEALRARTEEIVTLMEVSPIGILVAHDPECNLITGNPSAYTLLGMPADSQGNLSKLLSQRNSTSVRVLRNGVELAVEDLPLQTAARLGMEIEEETLEFLFDDGIQKYVYIFAKPLFDSQGASRGVIAAMLDISERMRMVQSLRDSEERFAKAFRVSPEAIIISRLADGQILDVNNSWLTLFGYEMQEAVGKTSLELNLFANREDRDKVVHLLGEQGYIRDFELDIRRKSGELRRVILAIESIEISGADCLISILHDVTDRRQAEEARQESEERYRALVNQATAGIVRKDPNGKILFVNQAFCNMLDQVDSELVGRTMWELTHEEDVEQNQRLYQRLMAEGIPFRMEKRLTRRDGSFLWVNVSVSPVMDLAGRPQSAVSVYVDINQRKQAESRLTLLARTSEIIREYEDPEELMYAVSRVVGEHFQARRALFNEIDLDHNREVVHRDYCREVISVAGEHKITDYSNITTAEMIAGRTVVNRDSKLDTRTAADYERSYVPYGERAYVAVPLLHEERWVASLWISDDKPRQWNEDDVRLLETIAERTWTAAEKLRIDRALRESVERLRVTINTTAVGFAALTPETRFEEMNDAFCRMVGYSREELLKMNWEMLIHPDYIRSTKDHLDDLLAGHISSFDIEKLYVQGDGSEIWMQNSVSLIRDEEGNPAQLILLGLDITDRVRTEKALQELNLELEERVRSRTAELQSAYEALRINEEKLRTLFEILPVGISFLDKDGNINEINNALTEILGLSRKEILTGKYKSRHYIRADGTPMPPSEFASTRVLTEQKTIYNVETGIFKENGEITWTNVNAAPVQVADVEAAIVTVDITERKQAEEALRQNRERLRVLSRRLVEVQEEERHAIARELHDRVGQNLAALTLNLNILRNQLSTEALDKVGTRLDDSVTLVKDILTITRSVMADLRPNVLDDYGLDAALNEYADRFMQRYGIRVLTQVPKKPIPRLDPGVEMTVLRIAQEALTNIARHAQASQAVIAIDLQNDAVLMTVEDNGMGILSWQKVNQPGSHGLRIMRERAEAFGGYLKVHSTYKNGTTIEVKIPFTSNLPGNSSKEKRS